MEDVLNAHMQTLVRMTLQESGRITKLTLTKSLKKIMDIMKSDDLKEKYLNRGEQSLKDLNDHDKKIKIVEIENADIQEVRKTMNSYGLDFNIRKINEKVEIAFKAPDEERAVKALEKVVPQLEDEIKDKFSQKEIDKAERLLDKGGLSTAIGVAEKVAKEFNEKVDGLNKVRPDLER